MYTLVCRVFKWNYEQLLYGQTFLPTDIRFARANAPLNRKYFDLKIYELIDVDQNLATCYKKDIIHGDLIPPTVTLNKPRVIKTRGYSYENTILESGIRIWTVRAYCGIKPESVEK